MNKHWHELIVLFISLVFGGVFASFFSSLFLSEVSGNDINLKSYIFGAIFTQFFMFGGAAFLFFRLMGIDSRQYISVRFTLKREWIDLIIFLLMAIAIPIVFSPIISALQSTYADHPWVIHQVEVNALQKEILSHMRGIKLPLALFIFAVIPAVIEEIIFRGILYKIIKGLTNRKIMSAIISATIFSLFHFQALSFIPIMLVGTLLAILYERTNNLLNPILLHFAFNAIQIIIL